MFSHEDIDLVSICTLESSHHKIATAASNVGVKGIFCEKPIADTIPHAKEMIDVCNKNKTVLLIDHQRRFDPLFSIIKKEIEDDLLGTIYHSNFYYTAGIFNTGTHVIDLLRYFFGDIKWVIGEYSKIKSSKPKDPNIDGVLKFKNGVTATIRALNVNDYLIFEQDILGSKGRLGMYNSGFRWSYQKIANSKYFSGYKELAETSIPFKLPVKREYMLEAIKHLTKCVEKRAVPISSGYDGIKDLQAIFALIRSAKDSSKKIFLTYEK
jgi:predicted dehydrogenase